MDLDDAAIDVLHLYFELGNDVAHGPLATVTTAPACPQIYDANCLTRIRAHTPAEIDAVFAEADRHHGQLGHRCFKLDPRTPSAFEARLVLDGFESDVELQLVLEDELRVTSVPAADIRPVTSDGDWASLGRLMRADHEETAAKGDEPCWDQSVSDQMLQQRRLKSAEVHFFLARADGADCAFFSSWPGRNGLGKVEDLFTLPEFRHRGIATALIVHCVDDARRRGAGPVLIGAVAGDTPRHMYAALGFRPLLVYRSFVKTA